jgi:hypothetical protein
MHITMETAIIHLDIHALQNLILADPHPGPADPHPGPVDQNHTLVDLIMLTHIIHVTVKHVIHNILDLFNLHQMLLAS